MGVEVEGEVLLHGGGVDGGDGEEEGAWAGGGWMLRRVRGGEEGGSKGLCTEL
jgi:hypothetical protein